MTDPFSSIFQSGEDATRLQQEAAYQQAVAEHRRRADVWVGSPVIEGDYVVTGRRPLPK